MHATKLIHIHIHTEHVCFSKQPTQIIEICLCAVHTFGAAKIFILSLAPTLYSLKEALNFKPFVSSDRNGGLRKLIFFPLKCNMV